MTRYLTAIKICLMVAGILVFGYGIRRDDSRARLIGIGIVGVGFLLRFARPRTPS